jgi:hypothetical protein
LLAEVKALMPLKALITLGGDGPLRGGNFGGGLFLEGNGGAGDFGQEMLTEVNERRVLRLGMIKKVKGMNFLARKLCYKT